ncbi:MAG: molybdate ABC transporter substrate-binding protein [Paracoccus sp. (in: a-proteobacteria)]|uniref:molybdate ABC transporter substrate-binding protein n=1 Tax=Paracoccus sp. TaxID=267 RepID=UPI0026DEB758|nr:molybdate ABC transporter substrate-binding protein [Paracoccus sp. (in: a-proteobacteria)]MDO5631198.1 molybdate ABC transporter substrate-binding protein [Paracoccus sp. (in: a-proteobacteria)]
MPSLTRRAVLAATIALLPVVTQAEDITIFAAASLKTALDRIVADVPGTVVISYSGSSALARQIVSGAPADIFISASVPWMDEVETAGLIVDDSRRDLLGNDLVLIAHGQGAALESLDGFAATLGNDKLAMALVDSVPAGVYGKQALESLGQWAALEPHVAQADDVRAALALVASGAAPYGIVYASDAAAEPAVSVVYTFPDDSHDPITYPAARLTDNTAAAEFLNALSGDAARAVFAENGFKPLPE